MLILYSHDSRDHAFLKYCPPALLGPLRPGPPHPPTPSGLPGFTAGHVVASELSAPGERVQPAGWAATKLGPPPPVHPPPWATDPSVQPSPGPSGPPRDPSRGTRPHLCVAHTPTPSGLFFPRHGFCSSPKSWSHLECLFFSHTLHFIHISSNPAGFTLKYIS